MPAYNEERCIEGVCRDWLEETRSRWHTLLVVDDGSTDRTTAILTRLAKANPGMKLVRQANGGHGSAVLRGYREALALGCAWVFQVDSDGQFRPSDFGRLWDLRGTSACILGHRKVRLDAWHRRCFSGAHRNLLRLFFGMSPQDPNIPYRLVRADLLASMLDVLPTGVFAPNVCIGLLGMRWGHDPVNVPVQHLARLAGTNKLHLSALARVSARHCRDLIRFRLGAFAHFSAISKHCCRTCS
jgi:glycosyltransferase involved in cell wall biosynthesis